MCGINIIFDPDGDIPEKQELIGKMNSEMSYRGPDDEGTYSNDVVALGMRRLSIIDIEGGHQPLFNEDKSLAIICSGEIYNYIELRNELENQNHTFSSHTDIEVILHLYEDKGFECIHDLRGIFAFALWDNTQKLLFVARDHVGVKPLYFYKNMSNIYFSSELKAIKRVNPNLIDLNRTEVWQYLHYGYPIDQRNTVVEKIQRVLPGEYVVVGKKSIKYVKYWQPRFTSNKKGNKKSFLRKKSFTKRNTIAGDFYVLDMLKRSVEIQLRSDVPVAILLSGGIDSSAIASIAAEKVGNCTAICAGYAGSCDCDERSIAHRTAERIGLPYIDVVLDSKTFADAFNDLMLVIDEPVADVASMPQWCLYRNASEKGFKVVLSGIGGDEVFFGYQLWNTVGAELEWKRLIKNFKLFRYFDIFDPGSWSGHNRHSGFQSSLHCLERCAKDEFKSVSINADHPLLELQLLAKYGQDKMYSMLFGSWLVHNCLHLADKLGMGNSTEIRVPFLDPILAQTVFSMPLETRYEKKNPKALLKRILRGIVSEDVLYGPKRGFTPPHDFVKDLVLSNREEILNGVLCKHFLNSNCVAALFEDNIGFMFKILTFERWFQVYSKVGDLENNGS